MKQHGFSPARHWIWVFGMVSVILAVLLTVQSINDQRLHDPVCQGLAGAGFPLTFLCDSLGSSPTGSWGKIDEADILFPNFFFLVDVLFYTLLLWLPWVLAIGVIHRVRRRRDLP